MTAVKGTGPRLPAAVRASTAVRLRGPHLSGPRAGDGGRDGAGRALRPSSTCRAIPAVSLRPDGASGWAGAMSPGVPYWRCSIRCRGGCRAAGTVAATGSRAIFRGRGAGGQSVPRCPSGQGREALLFPQGAGLAYSDWRGMQPIVRVVQPVRAQSFRAAHASQRGVLQQARMHGAGGHFSNDRGTGDGDGVGALGFHRRAGDGQEHGIVFLILGRGCDVRRAPSRPVPVHERTDG